MQFLTISQFLQHFQECINPDYLQRFKNIFRFVSAFNSKRLVYNPKR